MNTQKHFTDAMIEEFDVAITVFVQIRKASILISSKGRKNGDEVSNKKQLWLVLLLMPKIHTLIARFILFVRVNQYLVVLFEDVLNISRV